MNPNKKKRCCKCTWASASATTTYSVHELIGGKWEHWTAFLHIFSSHQICSQICMEPRRKRWRPCPLDKMAVIFWDGHRSHVWMSFGVSGWNPVKNGRRSGSLTICKPFWFLTSWDKVQVSQTQIQSSRIQGWFFGAKQHSCHSQRPVLVGWEVSPKPYHQNLGKSSWRVGSTWMSQEVSKRLINGL